MALSRQIKVCAIDVLDESGSSVSSKKNVEVFSGSISWRPYFYGGQAFKEALSGKLISDLGGYRPFVTLNWERLTNTSNLRNIVNDAVTASGNRRVCVIYPDASNTTFKINTVIEDVAWEARIDSTIISQPISVSFAGQNVEPSIPVGYESV